METLAGRDRGRSSETSVNQSQAITNPSRSLQLSTDSSPSAHFTQLASFIMYPSQILRMQNTRPLYAAPVSFVPRLV